MGKPRVFFRADGSSKMGLGHIYRSLALAEMLSDDFEIHFITRTRSLEIEKVIYDSCGSCINISVSPSGVEEAEMLINEHFFTSDIVVLDGYHFTTDYQKLIKSKGCSLVCIDDIHAYHFVADVVINHAGGITVNDYSKEDFTKLYLGVEYALIRKPFRTASRNRDKSKNEEGAVFVCLGGADPHNDTLGVISKVLQDPSVKKIYLVLGSAYLYQNEIEELLETNNGKIEILKNLDADQMVEFMSKCSTAITPPSSISYEYLSVGGDLFLKTIADNQKRIYTYFIENKFAYDFNNYPIRSSLKIDLQKVFDGRSNERFLAIFKSFCR